MGTDDAAATSTPAVEGGKEKGKRAGGARAGNKGWARKGGKKKVVEEQRCVHGIWYLEEVAWVLK